MRERGFAVFVDRADSLQPLQALCFRDTWNDCLTARYRLQTGPVVGTLFSALLRDLDAWHRGEPIRGDILPEHFERGWDRLVAFLIDRLRKEIPQTSALWHGTGTIDPFELELLFRALADEAVLPLGHRLVVFAEADVGGRFRYDDGSVNYLPSLFAKLPERVGVVMTPAPSIDLVGAAADDPHLLFLPFLPVPGPSREVFAFGLSALHGDRPAERDLLGFAPFAEGLARLILLPGTQPLTVGIHGPWGKGKSSFMQFIEASLVTWAAENQRYFRPSIPKRLAYRLVRSPDAGASVLGSRALLLGAYDEYLKRFEVRRGESGSLDARELADHAAVLAGRGRLRPHMEKMARRNVVSVRFNAWRFEDATQIWAGLASEITAAIERSLPLRSRLWIPVAYAWRNRRADLLIDLVLPTVIAALLLAVLLLTGSHDATSWANTELAKKLPSLGPIPKLTLPAGVAFGVALWLVAARVHRVIRPVSDRVLEYVRLPDYREQMGYQHRVLADVRFIRERMRRNRPSLVRRTLVRVPGVRRLVAPPYRDKTSEGAPPRVVIFIDDLDRCSEEKVMDILQAVNLILGASDFYVFLGIDTEMIHRAIESHYRKSGDDRKLPPHFADRYLEKIIQLDFHLPEGAMDDLSPLTRTTPKTNLINDLFSPTARAPETSEGDDDADDGGRGTTDGDRVAPAPAGSPDGALQVDVGVLREPVTQVVKEVADTPHELKAFLSFERYLPENPRELKRLLNVHRLVKILLQRPEVVGTPQDQRKLVKWLVFCSCWPDLVGKVLECAHATPSAEDCLRDVGMVEKDRMLVAFASIARPAEGAPPGAEKKAEEPDVLAAEDLKPGSRLALATQISQMILRDTSRHAVDGDDAAAAGSAASAAAASARDREERDDH
ncbi:MAG TPA: P-loop NTPase fold protein [Gaiellaceae bacterium]